MTVFIALCSCATLATMLMKKRSERRKHCALAVSKAESKFFAPPQTPFQGAQDDQKFNRLKMVTTFTYKPSLVRINAHNFELSW